MLITNGTVLTFGAAGRVIPGGAVYFTGDTIAEVGSTAELTAKHPGEEILDAAGKIVMPGLMCGHTHFYGAFARGMAIAGAAPSNSGARWGSARAIWVSSSQPGSTWLV